MLRAEEVAVDLTSSGPRVRISIVSEGEEVQLVIGMKNRGGVNQEMSIQGI
jgi:hypothetical protein